MAVVIKSNVTKNDCLSFDYNQTTGVYSVTNLNGWGAPNKALTDVATSILVISNSKSGITYDDIIIDASAGSTETYIFAELFLNSTPIGTENISDGIYSFTHTVTFNDETAITNIAYIVSLCTLNCSIQAFTDTMLDTVDDCCSDNKKELLTNYSEIMTLYDLLLKSALCNNFTAFNSIYSSIELLLLNINCI